MRKMASIRTIDSISPIEGADSIELATLGGWKVVVKKDEFKVNDLVVYLEIDSWVPHELAPFLSKGTEPREYNNVKGERLRTVKLRGQVSQGLLLSRHVVLDKVGEIHVGMDVSDILNVQKYEPPMSVQLAGAVRGNFPSFIPKTDQERVQNISLENFIGMPFQVTEKLDGSSMTIYKHEGVFGVCSRNIDLVETKGNSFWDTARELFPETPESDIFFPNGYAVQGELVGPGIQGNPYKLSKRCFYVYNLFDINSQTYCSTEVTVRFARAKALMHVPVVATVTLDGNHTCSQLLAMAEGKSVLNKNTEREGFVFKSYENAVSFKVISNKFLLKKG